MQLNETDISSVKLGERCNLSFDAISGLTLTGKVTLIDIQGTVSSGVVTYNVTITPDIQDPRLKPGMTVTADIITAAHTDVLTVPNAAVKTARDGSNYVEVLSNGQPVQKTVQIGLANDTDTEVTGGLTANDTVITQTIQPNATSTTARSGGGFGLGGGRPPGGIVGGAR